MSIATTTVKHFIARSKINGMFFSEDVTHSDEGDWYEYRANIEPDRLYKDDDYTPAHFSKYSLEHGMAHTFVKHTPEQVEFVEITLESKVDLSQTIPHPHVPKARGRYQRTETGESVMCEVVRLHDNTNGVAYGAKGTRIENIWFDFALKDLYDVEILQEKAREWFKPEQLKQTV